LQELVREGFHLRRPEKARAQSSTGVRAAGRPASLSIRGDSIEASSAHRAQAGLLAAEATMRHQAGLSVRGADEVLTAALAVLVPLEASAAAVAVAASEVLTEVPSEEATVVAEALVGATGKLKHEQQKKDPCGPSSFCPIPD